MSNSELIYKSNLAKADSHSIVYVELLSFPCILAALLNLALHSPE